MRKIRRALAEQKAAAIHLLYPETCVLPINPIEVARKLGVDVFVDDTKENLDGWYNAEKNAIYLNTKMPLLRRRFTVCHELGHAVLGHGTKERSNVKTYSKERYDPDEVEANIFATCLLMPKNIVGICVDAAMNLDQMCRLFGVSNRAMTIRLKQLGYLHEEK